MTFKDGLLLNNGKEMPIIGLGTWQGHADELEKALDAALEMGYRHIDTAFNYQNEGVIGKVLAKWLSSGKIKREELFVVTKLPLIGMTREGPSEYLAKSLAALQLDYVDLYLVHTAIGCKNQGDDTKLFPFNDKGELDIDPTTDLCAVWKGMEEQVDKGKAKAIGVSNFVQEQIERISKSAKHKPANLQVEIHAYFQQKGLRKFCEKHGITVCAYGPLGSPGRKDFYSKMGAAPPAIPALMDNEVVKRIAKRHRVTPGQVLLRHLAQENVIVIPKSTNPSRIQLNYQIFNFCLSPDEIQELDNLDQGPSGRSFDFSAFKGVEKHPEYRL